MFFSSSKMFEGLFFSCSVFGSCPSNILKGSFCFCFLPVKYFQGILVFFVSWPSPIFSRDAFVLMFFLCDVFVVSCYLLGLSAWFIFQMSFLMLIKVVNTNVVCLVVRSLAHVCIGGIICYFLFWP